MSVRFAVVTAATLTWDIVHTLLRLLGISNWMVASIHTIFQIYRENIFDTKKDMDFLNIF
jgi:hypothetical protein